MPTIYEGDFSPPPGRFAVVAARFNQFIVDHLVEGALDGLKRHGVADESVDIVRVPGSWEIPLVAHRLATSHKYVAVICLGAIIRGETDHYDYVAGEAAKGVAHASQATGVPVIFGILTCDTLEQAINRAGAKGGNKGFDAALTALEMVNLLKQLPDQPA
jgi:6,7-dimethyl-8-ribityllumazine synthase